MRPEEPLLGGESKSPRKMNKIRLILLAAAVVAVVACSDSSSQDLSKWVDPFIGTGGHGHTYPGATLPFGMVQLSPDTRLKGWDGCSGYHYSDEVIFGFSHTHLSGTGVSDYGDILFMPTVGEVQVNNGSPEDPSSGYCSRFYHEEEKASPGYYSVFLDDYGVKAELTVTKRAGLHKYTFPATHEANIIIDLEHRDPVVASSIRIVDDSEIWGFRRSDQWAHDQVVYFVAKFSQPFRKFGIAVDSELQKGISQASGRNIKAFVTFSTPKKEPVLIKVGISAVSCAGARKNLMTEIPGWDFSRVRIAAEAAWNKSLGKIQIRGGSREQRTIFYTALYHAMLAPNLFMDVDGLYRGKDLEPHQVQDFDYYTVFSLWDTFRAAHPLFTLIEQKRTLDFIRTFLAQYKDGHLLPVWELAANETWCMIGYHSVSVIADAYLKGITGFDTETAFRAMRRSADQNHFGLEFYKKLGFIPAEKESESVSKTLEYAYDDWCVAQMARALGKEDEYHRFMQRAQNYKNIFDPDTGFMRARMHAGWFSPFDPREVNFNYTEANSWQYSFFVPQDISGLLALMGGREKFVERLDELFTADSQTTGRKQADITGLIGQYAHGNEPSHHIAYLYNYAGQPWKTQEKVREILDTMYTDQPDGLSGNEDCGQMSAWYILSAMGFYPITPGQGIYALGTPLFPQAEIHLENGRSFTIKAKGISDDNFYIHAAKLNGQDYTRSFISHADILEGGELVLIMGPEPNREWGTQSHDIPQSRIDKDLILPVPFVAAGTRSFTGSQEVALGCLEKGAIIRFSRDETAPKSDFAEYTEPFSIDKSTVVRFFAEKNGLASTPVIRAAFHRIPEEISINLKSAYSSQYSAGGDLALIDSIRGGYNFRTGTWQGYHGIDLEAVVDLGKVKTVRSITAGFLQDIDSWIFMPYMVEYALAAAEDQEFEIAAVVNNDVSLQAKGVKLKDFKISFKPVQAQYVKITAKNIGICPKWHKGAGEKAWIFCDEIIIK